MLGVWVSVFCRERHRRSFEVVIWVACVRLRAPLEMSSPYSHSHEAWTRSARSARFRPFTPVPQTWIRERFSRPQAQHERRPHHCRWLWGAEEIDGLVPPATAGGQPEGRAPGGGGALVRPDRTHSTP